MTLQADELARAWIKLIPVDFPAYYVFVPIVAIVLVALSVILCVKAFKPRYERMDNVVLFSIAIGLLALLVVLMIDDSVRIKKRTIRMNTDERIHVMREEFMDMLIRHDDVFKDIRLKDEEPRKDFIPYIVVPYDKDKVVVGNSGHPRVRENGPGLYNTDDCKDCPVEEPGRAVGVSKYKEKEE